MKHANFINLTPHFIKIYRPDGTVDIPPDTESGPARAKIKEIETGEEAAINGVMVPITKQEISDTVNLPLPKEGVCYITSLVVAQAVKREDVYFPTELIRNGAGQVVGCKSLGQFLQ